MTIHHHPSYLPEKKGSDGQRDQILSLVDDWCGRLEAYRNHLLQEPQFNPIKQLSFEISRSLESGKLTQHDLATVAKELSDRALIRRATRLREYLGEIESAPLAERLRMIVRRKSLRDGKLIPLDEFKGLWETPFDGFVFTGHPTFAMSEQLRHVLVCQVKTAEVSDNMRDDLLALPHRPDPAITLESEHSQALNALSNAREAVRRMNVIVLEEARTLYPDDWQNLVPNPVSIACWVGYDIDGRTDINWRHMIRFRLEEKLWQIQRHLDDVRAAQVNKAMSGAMDAVATLGDVESILKTEAASLRQQITLFGADLSSPESLSQAADMLTREPAGELRTSITPVVEKITAAISNADDKSSMVLVQLRSLLVSQGLGSSRIHLRLNAMQLHNAIRKPLGIEGSTNIESRVLLDKLDKMITGLSPESVNFASLAVEQTTAIRQFITIAQIFKHIDGDAPIRLLIAECNHPFTILAALYFARLFGITDRLDISPLFETEDALEHGAGIIETLLKTQSFRSYVEARGRISIETGFSDAGRNLGQIPTALAVERLQGQLASLVKSSGLTGVGVLMFDTHGESMGRGAHPTSFRDRMDYILSPWVRARYESKEVPLQHEMSIQGGDGYTLFGSADLAFACLAQTIEARWPEQEAEEEDAFYEEYTFSRDYFERMKSYQTRLFESPNYAATLGAFGVNLIVESGSRKSKRQFDAGRDERVAIAEMRAIPHNALLQQYGYLINVVAGLGTSLRRDQEKFGEIYARSNRTRRLFKMLAHARQLSSIKTLVAYASLFDDAFWVTRPIDDLEPHLKDACLYLAHLLRGDSRHDAMMHLASYLREDAIHLHDLVRAIGEDPMEARLPERTELDVLQAIRIALIQHIFLLAARLPRFSTRNDISQDDIMNLILKLRVEEATALLRDAYPKRMPSPDDYTMDEQASYTGYEGSDYAEINDLLIDPMLSAYQSVLDISVGISHHFGAHG